MLETRRLAANSALDATRITDQLEALLEYLNLLAYLATIAHAQNTAVVFARFALGGLLPVGGAQWFTAARSLVNA
jgi:hypothetical protein